LSSIGRWAIGLDSLPDNGLKVVVERAEGQIDAADANAALPEEVTVKEEIADVMNQIDQEDTKACEQILDNFLEMTTASQQNGSHPSILDTAWEDTFGDVLFPDLGDF